MEDSWILFFLSSFAFHTTHAQILLSLRYNVIPLYLNLGTHKMVKRKIPLITSSVGNNTQLRTHLNTEQKIIFTRTNDGEEKLLSGSREWKLRRAARE